MAVMRSDSAAYTLASNLSASGTGVAIPGGEYMFSIEGTIAGGTVQLQYLSPNGTWIPVNVYGTFTLSFTALPAAVTAIDLPAGTYRMGVSAGSPTGIYAYLFGLG